MSSVCTTEWKGELVNGSTVADNYSCRRSVATPWSIGACCVSGGAVAVGRPALRKE